MFSKCGVIAESAESNKPRIKLYYDDEGKFKGDALVGKVFYRKSCGRELMRPLKSFFDTSLCRLPST